MIKYDELVNANTICDICKLFYNDIGKNKLLRYWPKRPDKFLYQRKIIIFGAGNFGKKVIETITSKGLDISYICDNDCMKWGKSINGVKICSPDQLNSEDKNKSIVIICSTYYDEIELQLVEKDMDYIYSTIEGKFYYYLPNYSDVISEKLNYYWERKEKITEVCDLLLDEYSKKVYLDVLKAKIIEDDILYRSYFFSLLGSIYEGNQYFDNRYFSYSKNEVFIDCGAFSGDTILDILNSPSLNKGKNNSQFIYAFEPDIANYNMLQDTLRINSYDDYVKTILAGVGNIEGKLEPGVIHNCRYDDIINDFEVPLIRLDDVMLNNTSVTFIKMDIEGYELDALKGAEMLIKKNKPKLAICIYHRPEHYFEIPLLLKKFVPEYKVFIKQHVPYKTSETVCYAYV